MEFCCQRCGYNLRGVCTSQRPAGACPECGEPFERSALVRADLSRAGVVGRVMAWQLIAPAIAAAGTAVATIMDAMSDYGSPVGFATLLLLAIGVGLGASGVGAFHLARRIRNRPPRADFTPGDAALMALLWPVLLAGQCVIAFAGFAAGCLALSV